MRSKQTWPASLIRELCGMGKTACTHREGCECLTCSKGRSTEQRALIALANIHEALMGIEDQLAVIATRLSEHQGGSE